MLGDVVGMLCYWFCDENITVWAGKLFLFVFFFWKLPYFSIAHARNFGKVTALTVHDPLFECKIKPQNLLTTTSMYGGHVSNNKVCRFICSEQSRGDHFYRKSAIFISPQKWLDWSTGFWFILYQIGGRWCRNVEVTDFVMKHNSLSLKIIFIHLYFQKITIF